MSPTITVTAITGGHRVEITDADGTKTFSVMDGQTGATPDLQIGTVTTLPAGSEATAEITGTPVQILGLLKNPIEYTLTAEQVSGILETLYGTNNIWTDVGTVDVEYPADTRLFIEQLTKPTEDDMTADHAISSGTFFMVGNNLYLATSQIAAGGTITPGTNATQLSLADALNQLNT